MLSLIIASSIFWGRNGTAILMSNWATRPKGTSHTIKAIFNGICVGFLGVTGIYCLAFATTLSLSKFRI